MIDGGPYYQSLTLEAKLTILEKENPYVPVKPGTPDDAASDIEKLPGAEEYNQLEPYRQALVKEAVDTAAAGIAGMTPEEQANISVESIEKLGGLYDTIYNVSVEKDTSTAGA